MGYVGRKVSVIIPVYNAEDYLVDSLGDMLSQTYTDFEVICVNDGSTDNSEAIIEDFCKKDDRIRLISQSNCGGGAARNKGYDHSNGDYILFLDADDRFEKQLIENAVLLMEREKSDVLVFAADEFHYETGIKKPAPWLLQSGYERYDGNPFHYTTTTVWNKMYRHDFLARNNIRHQDERVTAFSMYFTFFALFYASKIDFLDEVLVHYMSEN
uniref:glycosyltransferase family 2 protein n=1 Tax=Ruminococcus sp. TaxID=41978 RepID=UPI0025D90CC0